MSNYPDLFSNKQSRSSATAEIPPYEYTKFKKDFGFSSFLNKLEVVRTLVKVRIECDKLSNTSLFVTNITKTVRLDEFEQMQSQSLQNVKASLKDT